MINLKFDSDIAGVKDIKLSAIFEADNFVYTTFDQDNTMLSYNGGKSYKSFDSLIDNLQPSTIKVAVKSKMFGHFGDQERIPIEGQKYIDKMTGKDIWCAYESPFTPKDVSVKHFSTVLNHEFFLNNDDVFLIHFDEDHLHFYVQSKGDMILYNCYQMKVEADLLYYHSLISQSLQIDVENTTLVLTGIIEEKSKAYTQLSPFHNKIQFGSGLNFKIKTDRQDLKPHHFFDHMINLRCGL